VRLDERIESELGRPCHQRRSTTVVEIPQEEQHRVGAALL
jgi:hypothetical protein